MAAQSPVADVDEARDFDREYMPVYIVEIYLQSGPESFATRDVVVRPRRGYGFGRGGFGRRPFGGHIRPDTTT